MASSYFLGVTESLLIFFLCLFSLCAVTWILSCSQILCCFEAQSGYWTLHLHNLHWHSLAIDSFSAWKYNTSFRILLLSYLFLLTFCSFTLGDFSDSLNILYIFKIIWYYWLYEFCFFLFGGLFYFYFKCVGICIIRNLICFWVELNVEFKPGFNFC